MLSGIDVSNWRGTVDWDAVVGGGVQFAFAKASEGTNFTDPQFARNWSEIRRVGLPRGAYHFAQPDQNAPQAEADFFLSTVGPLQLGDLLALDLEAGTGDLTAWTLAWLARVAEQVGFRPLLYSGSWFMQPRLAANNPELPQHGLWLAAYTGTMPAPPLNWPVIAFWQHTRNATIPGVQGDCDASFFNGDAAQLPLYGKPSGGVAAHLQPAAPAVAPSAGDYVSRPGDTVAGIAAALGCTPQDLLNANPPLVLSGPLAPGTVIHLPQISNQAPTGTTQTYVVRSGDSLSGIAARLGVSLLALERANPTVTDPNLIVVGETLSVPMP
jgi:GH25 family lysozyme M1 (1,4-beta-N-acetylmuramidase)/LysM repeat protein